MPLPEDPPGFVVRTEAQKAAWDNGYRLDRGTESGGWIHYGSTTAHGDIWIGGVPPRGPWFLSVDHPGVAAELRDLSMSPASGPGVATWVLDSATRLHDALDRVYRLGVSLPDAPLARFEAATGAMPHTTEAERLVVQRVGQDLIRNALMDYWGGRCAVTGLAIPELLRASHIEPWADCATDAERLDVFNGLLLAPNLDAAFDPGFVTVADDGAVLASTALDAEAGTLLGIAPAMHVARLSPRHRHYLDWHRRHLFRAGPGVGAT